VSGAARPWRLLAQVATWVIALSMVAPVLWVVSTSLKSDAESLGSAPALLPAGWPAEWHWSNYARAWRIAEFGRFYANSLIAAGAVTLLSVAHNALAGFAFAKLRFRGRRVLFAAVLSTVLLPFQVSFIFAYLLCGWLGYTDRLQALIVPFLASGAGIFYMRQATLAVPDALLEAGRLDGLGDLDLFVHVVAPLVRPAAAALAIFTFMGSWNSFFWPLVVLDSTDRFVLPLAVSRLNTDYFSPSAPVRMAAATIMIVPTVLVYLAFERTFMRGMTLMHGVRE
jgi:multiple sugar transport system permease protein